jgi:hypothetical protein
MSLILKSGQDCRLHIYSGSKSLQGIFWRCWHVASRCRIERLFVLSSLSIMSTPSPPRAEAVEMLFISIPDSTDRGCLYGTGTRRTQTPIHTVCSTRTQTSDASRTPFLPLFPFHRFSIVQTFHHRPKSKSMDILIMYSILYHTHTHIRLGTTQTKTNPGVHCPSVIRTRSKVARVKGRYEELSDQSIPVNRLHDSPVHQSTSSP